MENTRSVRVLAISGSLRRASSNSALVAAAIHVAPSVVHVSVFHDLAELPPFNPDIESEGTPDAIINFRAKLRACDAVLISSPEYAHGVPGVLKNALDWLVGSGELVDKPVSLINVDAGARAWASQAEIDGDVGTRDRDARSRSASRPIWMLKESLGTSLRGC
jgi:NAD(P)H-dependent FMN reductase